MREKQKARDLDEVKFLASFNKIGEETRVLAESTGKAGMRLIKKVDVSAKVPHRRDNEPEP